MYLDNIFNKKRNTIQSISIHDFYSIMISDTEAIMKDYTEIEKFLSEYRLKASESCDILALEGAIDTIKSFFMGVVNFIKKIVNGIISLIRKIFDTLFGNSYRAFEKAYKEQKESLDRQDREYKEWVNDFNKREKERQDRVDEAFKDFEKAKAKFNENHAKRREQFEEAMRRAEEIRRKAEEARRRDEEERRKREEELKRKREEREKKEHYIFDLRDFAFKISEGLRKSETIKKLKNYPSIEAFGERLKKIAKINVLNARASLDGGKADYDARKRLVIDFTIENRKKEFYEIYMDSVRHCNLIMFPCAISPETHKKNFAGMKEVMSKTKREYEEELNGLQKIADEITELSKEVYKWKNEGNITDDGRIELARDFVLLEKDYVTSFTLFIKKGCVLAASGIQKLVIFNRDHLEGTSLEVIRTFIDTELDRHAVDNL